MKKSIVGILAHVDAGKTTLAESLLCACGVIERAGRVDHGDAFLDNGDMERKRGITIFSKQARIRWKDVDITLLDRDMWISLRKWNGRCRYWMRRF